MTCSRRRALIVIGPGIIEEGRCGESERPRRVVRRGRC